ncbi:MAG: SGNH/GDSL hydrolase family protein [Byssovorax sp.]
MSGSGSSSLKSVVWFPKAKEPEPEGVASALAKLLVGVAIGGLLYWSGRKTFAYVVFGTSGVIGVISIASEKARSGIGRFFATLGRWIGTGIGTVLLSLVFFLFLTPLRFFRRLLGADDLHLRDADKLSFWLTADRDERKVRHVGAMFATEAPTQTGRPVAKALAVAIVLLAVAEGVLRTQGFGSEAVLYVSDPTVGYYTAPNQKLGRYGGRVETNKVGMRAPDYPVDKPAGVFRVLMLGDSTLYGGSYVDQDALYARLLEKKLNARAAAAGAGTVQVLNMGVNGWGPYHERGYVAKFGTFGADLAIICGPTDDLNRTHYGLMSVPFFSVDNPPALALEEVFMHLTWQYRRNRTALTKAWQDEQSAIGMLEYGRLIDDLQAKGAEVLFELLPSRDAGMGQKLLDQEQRWLNPMKVVADTRKVPIHFPEKLFVGRGKEDDLYHDRYHLNVLGHSVYADYLEKSVMETTTRFKQWLAHDQKPGGSP